MPACLSRGLLVAAAVCLILSGNRTVGQAQSSREARRQAARRNLARLKAMPPVRGILFHCCSCSVPCPCMYKGKDIEGCNIVRVYHITDGGYAGKDLVGLTAVYVPHPEDLKKKTDGLRKDGKPVDAALYLPVGITPHQEQALMGLLAENNMTVGWNTVLRRHAPISFRRQAGGYDVVIDKVFHARMNAVKGANGKPVIANHLKLEEGSRWHIGRSAVHDYQDAEEKAWQWKLPKSNGSWTFFAWGPHIDPADEIEANRK